MPKLCIHCVTDSNINLRDLSCACLNCQEHYPASGDKRAHPGSDSLNQALAAFYSDEQNSAKRSRLN